MATVSIGTPVGSVGIPCMSTGVALPAPGRTLTGMSYQVNDGPVHPIGAYVPTGGPWSFQVTPMDCPQPGPYSLTVFAGETGGGFGHDQKNFYRQP